MLLSCSTADLRFSQEASLDPEQGQRIVAEYNVRMGLEGIRESTLLEFEGVDRWNSWLVRQFTPVERAVQPFRARLSLKRPYMDLELEGKPSIVLGLEDGKVSTGSGLDRLYVKPTRDYLSWPLRLMSSADPSGPRPGTVESKEDQATSHPSHENAAHYPVFHGKKRVADKEYLAFFLRIPSPNGATDDLRIYLDTESLEMRFIHFTLRELSDSYSGWILYRDYRSIDGIRIPHEISIQDAPDPASSDFVHRLEITRVQVLH